MREGAGSRYARKRKTSSSVSGLYKAYVNKNACLVGRDGDVIKPRTAGKGVKVLAWVLAAVQMLHMYMIYMCYDSYAQC